MKVLRFLFLVLAAVAGGYLALMFGGYGPALETWFTPDADPVPTQPLPPDVNDTGAPDVEMPGSVDAPTVAEPPRLPSGLIMPVLGVEPAELVDTFEEARSQNRTHDAIDIIAPHRTPVLAAADGTIVRLFNSEKGGRTIYQRAPDDRTVYYYAHLDSYAEGIQAGVFAAQGTVIGYVGDTGNAVPGNYHLHFAIWRTNDPENFWDGEPINPYPLLKRE